jgi:hypothetical protein
MGGEGLVGQKARDGELRVERGIQLLKAIIYFVKAFS